jgi:hypothetical protein
MLDVQLKTDSEEMSPWSNPEKIFAITQHLDLFFPEDRHFVISIQQPDDNTNYYNLINGATGEEIKLYIVSEQEAREEDYDYLFNYGLIKKGILPNYILGEINSCFKKLNDEFYYEIMEDTNGRRI